MEEELSLDSILEIDEIEDLFVEDSTETSTEKEETKEQTTEEVDVEELFTDTPESVGSGKEDSQDQGKDSSSEVSTSPNSNFYSSIAKALKEEGIFPDLDDKDADLIKAPEDFAQVIEKQLQSKLDEKQRRVDEALNAGVEIDSIKDYEQTLSILDSIKEDALIEEGENGDKLRKQLIYQDFINRGYSDERAKREVQKSFTAGSDIEDAKEALLSNKEHFNRAYQEIIDSAKKEVKKEEELRKEQAKTLKKVILEDTLKFGDITIDGNTKQKIYDSISKPVFKDKESGEVLTAIQKYERENRVEFLTNLGIVFTLTNGFKNLDGLVNTKVKKEVKKGLRELEHTLNNSTRTTDGNLKLVSGVSDDPESFISKGWALDV